MPRSEPGNSLPDKVTESNRKMSLWLWKRQCKQHHLHRFPFVHTIQLKMMNDLFFNKTNSRHTRKREQRNGQTMKEKKKQLQEKNRWKSYWIETGSQKAIISETISRIFINLSAAQRKHFRRTMGRGGRQRKTRLVCVSVCVCVCVCVCGIGNALG